MAVTPALARDKRCWASSTLIGVIFTAGSMLLSLTILPAAIGRRGWYVPQDVWAVFDGGRFVWNGALGFVYQGTGSYAMPLSFIVMAPIVGLCVHLGLAEGSPIPVLHPTAWLLVGPFTMLFGVFLLQAVRRLAWDLGLRRGLWSLQLSAVLVVLVPSTEWGHFEDVIALTMVVHAARRLIASEPLQAALLLSVAIASKQWSAVLVPLIVVQAGTGRRLRSLLIACALPAAFVAFVLGVDWNDASKALFSPVNLVRDTLGHPAFFRTWLGRATSRWSRTLGLVTACALGWPLRGATRQDQLLAAMAAILLARPFFEAINYGYYWSPALLLAGLVGVAVHRQMLWRDWIWPLGATFWGIPNAPVASWWWAGEMILLSATAYEVARSCGFIRAGVVRPGLAGPTVDGDEVALTGA